MFQFQCKQKGVSLSLHIDETLPRYITTDEDRLTQVINNLLANAIKFTFHGSIRVEVTEEMEESDCIQIAVIDTGIGIKDEDKENLFKMYGKLQDVHGVNKNGVGLGLNISSTLVNLLYNKPLKAGIQVKSDYGIGSEFSFKISKFLSLAFPIEPSCKSLLLNGTTTEDYSIQRQASIADAMETFPLKMNGRQIDKEDQELNQLGREEETSNPKINSSSLNSVKNFKLISSLSLPKLRDPPVQHNFQGLSPSGTLLKSPDQIHLELLEQQEIKHPVNNAAKEITNKLDQNRDNDLKLQQESEKNYIIVVDDNPFNILVAVNLLKTFQYPIKTAMGGQEAIDLVTSLNRSQKSIKVIFMDCQMPVMDGYETTRILKALMGDRQIKEVPIIAWTANTSDEDTNRCLECGMVDHLAKPTCQKDLINLFSKLS